MEKSYTHTLSSQTYAFFDEDPDSETYSTNPYCADDTLEDITSLLEYVGLWNGANPKPIRVDGSYMGWQGRTGWAVFDEPQDILYALAEYGEWHFTGEAVCNSGTFTFNLSHHDRPCGGEIWTLTQGGDNE